MNFCPGCGKSVEGKFCKECKPQKELKAKDLRVKMCTKCAKILIKNKWSVYNNPQDALLRAARLAIKDKSCELSVYIPKFKRNPGIKAEFEITAETEDSSFSIPGIIDVTYCDKCKKPHTYYEGTLQLRNVNKEIMDYVMDSFKQYGIFISDDKQQKNGIDLQVSDQKRIQNIGSELVKKYGGTLKVSAKIFTRDKQTSKEVHRVNVYFEPPEYKKGDVIEVEGKIIHISSLGKTIKGKDIISGKSVSMPMNDKEYEIIDVFKTTVSKAYPDIEILDPETYESVSVQNKKSVKQGQKVRVVNVEGRYYIF